MASYKERIEELIEETERLRNTAERQADASQEVVAGLDNLRAEMESTSDRFNDMSATLQEGLVNKFAAMKKSLEETFKKASRDILGTLLVASVAGPMIAAAIEERNNDPRMKMARKGYNVLHILYYAFMSGDRLDYDGVIKLLVIHEFTRDEAEYFVDRLMNKYEALVEWEWDDGTTGLMLDEESEFMKKANDAIKNKQLPYW